MDREVILVEFPWGRDKDPRVPLGHASLIAMLNKVPNLICHSIISPINRNFDIISIENQILAIQQNSHCRVDLAIGVYVWCEDVIKHLISSARKGGFKGQIILGGPQISYSMDGLEQIYPEADVFIRGYGEFAIAELMSNESKIDMKGVHYAGDDDLCEQTIVDLDLCPSPWLEGIIGLENQDFIRWETQRGCQFSCGFCQHKEAGSKLPKHNFCLNRIEQEIDLFCNADVKDIAVLDPIFNSSSKSIEILKRFAENKFSGRLSLQCRAEMVTDEFIEVASQLNVRLEFGLQTIHLEEGRAINRKNNMTTVGQTIDKINKAGIEYEISIIYGLPTQTLQSFSETVDWCLEKSVPAIKAFPLMLLRGTDTEKRRDEWGLKSSEDSMPVVIESDTFTFKEWEVMGSISQALKDTEYNHPNRIDDLLEISRSYTADISRFIPNRINLPSTTA